MANIIDYILWRGDLKLENAPFNEVDNLILSKLSYANFEGIINPENRRGITIEHAVKMYFEEGRDKKKNTGDLTNENFFTLLRHVASSNRYKDLKLKQYIALLDLDKASQFSALTIDLGNRTMYLAYRGTDDTLVGWKEDLMMSVMEQIPAQQEAVDYFCKVATRYRGYGFYLGGHSKGGNLAVYAAVNGGERLQKRIKRVYNNDGPGFRDGMLESKAYKAIADRISTYVPQSSIIGMMLEHEENYMVVKSSQKGFLQHDGFSWEVCGPSFIHLKSITVESRILDRTLKGVLNELSIEQREQFTNILFEILSSSSNKTITDIRGDSWKAIKAMLKTYEGLGKETKKALIDTLSLFISEGIRSILEVKTPEQWKEKLPILQWDKDKDDKGAEKVRIKARYKVQKNIADK